MLTNQTEMWTDGEDNTQELSLEAEKNCKKKTKVYRFLFREAPEQVVSVYGKHNWHHKEENIV